MSFSSVKQQVNAMRATSSASDAAGRLKLLIREKSYLTEGDFALASGASSSFFFDMKVTMLDPEGATLAAELILERIEGLRLDAVGGLVVGACPIVSAVCVRSHGRAHPVQGFYVRKEPKNRGTQKMIEGALLTAGMRVAILEDVTTSGGSALRAMQEVERLGCTVACVVTIVDREQGAAEAFAREGVAFYPLFTRRDFESAL